MSHGVGRGSFASGPAWQSGAAAPGRGPEHYLPVTPHPAPHCRDVCVVVGGGAVSRYRSLYVCVCVSVCPSSAQTPVRTAKDSGLAFFSPVSLGPSTKPST